jgi:hypothetical protein
MSTPEEDDGRKSISHIEMPFPKKRANPSQNDQNAPALANPPEPEKSSKIDVQIVSGYDQIRLTPAPPEYRTADYFSVQLPSDFYFYPWKSLAASRIRGKQQAKFTRAAAEENLSYVVEAVASTLADPALINEFTLVDFNYLMYWLRLMSYTKSQFTHLAVCSHPLHLKKVAAGLAHEDTLKAIHVLSSTTLEEKSLDKEAADRAFRITNAELADFGLLATAPRVHDLIPTDVYLEPYTTIGPDGETVTDEEHSMLADLAAHVRPLEGQQIPFEDRIKLVSELPVDVIAALNAFSALIGDYGIKEFISVPCKECGATVKTKVIMSAHCFL